jgi:hypothetical protein
LKAVAILGVAAAVALDESADAASDKLLTANRDTARLDNVKIDADMAEILIGWSQFLYLSQPQ